MPASPLPHLRVLPAGLVLALSVAMLALLLLLPSQALAKARSSSCRRPAGAQAKRHAHGCARHRHRSKSRHARHAGSAVTKRKGRARKAPSTLPPVIADSAAASCEDGSEPLQVEPEVYECPDGSEPGCEDGSALTVSDPGAKLLCSGDAAPGDGSGETECVAILSPGEDAEGASPLAEDATPACSSTSEVADPEDDD